MSRKILLPLILLQFTMFLYAEDQIWIDFGELPSGYMPEGNSPYVRQYDPAPIQEEDETVVDYTNIYDPYARQAKNLLPERFQGQDAISGNTAYDDMRLSLALDRWQVKLSSSSDFVNTRSASQVFAYNVKETSSRFAGEQVMGVYFTLPNLLVNSKAWVVPEFPVPAYSAPVGSTFEEESLKPATERMGQFLNKGVLRNIGPVRSITASVYGRRFPLSLTIEADHTDIGKRDYPMGGIQFSGWQELVWTNPNYVIDVRKRNYSTTPEYPRGMPSMILKALRLERPIHSVSESSSRVVFYIKQIRVVYDKAIPETFDSEIDDERVWQLNTFGAQERSYKQAMDFRYGAVDRYVELQERHPAFPPQDTAGAENAGNNNAAAQ